jgi:hypothetical protein
MHHVELTQRLQGGEGNLIERDIFIGAKELVPSRLVAVRMPEPIVNARRRVAKKTAKKKDYIPSKTHLNLLAWNLFTSTVPSMIWKTTPMVKAYPIRWQIELFQSQDIKFTRDAFFFRVGPNRLFFKGQHVVHCDRPIRMHHDLFHQQLDHCLAVLTA